MSEYFNQFFSEKDNSLSLIIEDDGRVAFAYLLKDKDILGDVWLYNQVAAPSDVNWASQHRQPFVNPVVFLKDTASIRPIAHDEDVEAKWQFGTGGFEFESVEIYVRNNFVALLRFGAKPGWSALVKKSGPLAKVMGE